MKLQIKIEIAFSGVYDVILDIKQEQLISLYRKLCMHLRTKSNNVSLHVLTNVYLLFAGFVARGKCHFKY
jgi:hypothetical protein